MLNGPPSARRTKKFRINGGCRWARCRWNTHIGWNTPDRSLKPNLFYSWHYFLFIWFLYVVPFCLFSCRALFFLLCAVFNQFLSPFSITGYLLAFNCTVVTNCLIIITIIVVGGRRFGFSFFSSPPPRRHLSLRFIMLSPHFTLINIIAIICNLMPLFIHKIFKKINICIRCGRSEKQQPLAA